MKISNAYYNILFNLLVAIIMSAIMSFVLTIVNAGMIDGFLGIWEKAFIVSGIVAIPVTFIAIPLVAKSLGFIFEIDGNN
jgi:hypothetical protein